MPKRSFSVSGAAADAELEGGNNYYDGDVPPSGVYRAILKKIVNKETKAGDNAFSMLYEIRNNEGAKKQYNGAGVFDWINDTDAGAPFMNRFLAAFGLPKMSKLGGYVTDEEEPPNVTKLGAKRVTGEWPCRIATKIDDRGQAKIASVLPPKDDDVEADDDAVDEDGPAGVALDESDDQTTEEGEVEPYTEDELGELDLDDLKSIAEQVGAEVKKGQRKATIIAAILEAQETAEAEGDEAGEAPESEGGVEALSEEEMEELELPDLKEYADSIELEYPPKVTKSKLINLIVEFLGAPEGDDEDEPAETGEALTKEELDEMETADLKAHLVETLGGTLPKPPLRKKIIDAILEKQGEPPF